MIWDPRRAGLTGVEARLAGDVWPCERAAFPASHSWERAGGAEGRVKASCLAITSQVIFEHYEKLISRSSGLLLCESTRERLVKEPAESKVVYCTLRARRL
jgi:hypothetical protein